MSLDKSLAFYKDRFADASDFTFVFVGSFDLATMKPLVERYLAACRRCDRTRAARTSASVRRLASSRRQVVKGVEPKSQVGVVFTGPFQNDQMHRVVMRAMAETLEGNLQRTLREDLGGTYGVSVRPDFDEASRRRRTA